VDAVQRWLTLVTLVAAALAALGYLTRQVWKGFQVIQRIHDVVNTELSPNSGSSMKDDVADIAVAVGRLQSDVRDLTTSKELAHEVLQLQLDTVADALALPRTTHHPQHRREEPPL
jgi:hypothetical protein